MERALFITAGVCGFLAVALGAFGAHGLERLLAGAPDAARRREWWETAALYHLAHALAIAVSAYLAGRGGGAPAVWSGVCFAAGVLLFSGSLYLMTLTGVRLLGAVTPVGGVLLLAGWIAVALAAWRLS